MAREKNVHTDYLKCDCHQYSGSHEFWEDLLCTYSECRLSWYDFQVNPTPCKGGKATSRRRYEWIELRQNPLRVF